MRVQVNREHIEYNLRFPGQYFDAETLLHQNYFRDYDPKTGSYIESDPIGLRGGINTYLYANANPLSYTDPTGQIAVLLPLVCAGGGCEAAATALVTVIGAVASTIMMNESLSGGDKNLQQAIEKEANRREYKNICNEPPPPKLDACELAKWNLRKAKACKAAREENTKKWWGEVDDRHSPLLAQQLDNAIRNAEAAVERACKCSE